MVFSPIGRLTTFVMNTLNSLGIQYIRSIIQKNQQLNKVFPFRHTRHFFPSVLKTAKFCYLTTHIDIFRENNRPTYVTGHKVMHKFCEYERKNPERTFKTSDALLAIREILKSAQNHSEIGLRM